jgi:competence protein ComEC
VDGGTLDAGARSDIGQAVIIPELQRRGIKRLDLLVLTHADSDHCSGLSAVVREVPVDNFLDGPAAVQAKPDPAELDYSNLRREVDSRRIRRTVPAAGQYFDLDGVRFTVLEPGGAPLEGDNNNAIVAMAEWGKSRVLLTADIEKPAEERLLRNYPDLHCNVLKVGHHGSKTSTSPELLAATHPGAAIISCGKYNPFGHPNAEVLQRLDDEGIPVFRTDANGAIDVRCTQESCGVTTFR